MLTTNRYFLASGMSFSPGGQTVWSDAAGDVDREAGDEVGVGRGEEADHSRLVGRLGDAAQRRAFDLLGLRGLRALLPVRPDALGQGDAGRDRVDVDAVGA